MPYITRQRRDQLQEDAAANHGEWNPLTAGELNYVFTMLAKAYFQRNHNYQGINDVIGALEGAKLEFYRRAVAPYEDVKIEQNGDL